MRQPYQCVYCGLRITGRVHDGQIVADDRSATEDTEPQPCVCMACAEENDGAYFTANSAGRQKILPLAVVQRNVEALAAKLRAAAEEAP